MAETIANIGYMAYAKETTKGTAVAPTNYVPLYKTTLNTLANFKEQMPIFGNRYGRFDVLKGNRSHKGEFTILGEANSAGRMFDTLMAKGTTTGAGPYTHPYTVSNTTDPKSLTVDISTGNVVARYMGVEASKISPDFDENEMRLTCAVSALSSFQGREIATISITTLTLKTDYDPNPNKGLIVGDLVRLYKESTGVTADFTIATVNADGITVTLNSTAAAFAAGDMIYLRPATPSFNLLDTFLWTKTIFGFGATAATALTNATTALQTRLEQGSTWSIMNNFESDDGAPRSGSADPAALVRTHYDATHEVKKYFDTPEEIRKFNSLEKRAVVIRHFAGSTNQYELRVTLNHIKTDSPMPEMDSLAINYANLTYYPIYDQTDTQAIAVIVINNLSTI